MCQTGQSDIQEQEQWEKEGSCADHPHLKQQKNIYSHGWVPLFSAELGKCSYATLMHAENEFLYLLWLPSMTLGASVPWLQQQNLAAQGACTSTEWFQSLKGTCLSTCKFLSGTICALNFAMCCSLFLRGQLISEQQQPQVTRLTNWQLIKRIWILHVTYWQQTVQNILLKYILN